MRTPIFIILLAVLFTACSKNKNKSDAYGNFESTEITISAEAAGKLLMLNIEEGQSIKAGEKIGLIDTVQLALKRDALIAQQKGASTKSANILAQIDVFKEQKNNALTDKARIEKLLKDGAATQKQLDDIEGVISVYDRQMASIQTQNAPVLNELEAYSKQIDQIQDQINRSYITNPINGTVLTKYSEPNEMVVQGKALYKIADLSEMILRVYVSGAQLSEIKVGQKVEVLIDADADNNKKCEGEISWISSNAEFTPKIIQTKEERVNLVYAVKVRVKNDGSIKIGMPGEVNFKGK
jgi:HlyD family secretion protein